MTSLDPLKSVISLGNVDDTSLALPSFNQCRTGQQRVLQQVQTIRRAKSKSRLSSSRSGSASLSPTSPSYDSVFLEPSKLQSGTSNGAVFFENGFSKTVNKEKNINLYSANSMKGTSVNRNAGSTYQYERGYTSVGSMPVSPINTSHSEPDMAWHRPVPKRSAPSQRLLSNTVSYRKERASGQFMKTAVSQHLPQPLYTTNGTGVTKTNSQFIYSQGDVTQTLSKPPVAETATKIKGNVGSNDNSKVADISMKEAVEYLSNEDESYQHCGASYIQHNAFIDDKAKEEVLKFKGIHPLVDLLHSSSSHVNETASAALRNVSFKSSKNKEEIHRSGGITEAVALLRDTDSVETHKQLTGLLWNLSSVDSLKPDLLKSALPVLMERVILPYTTGPDRANSSSQDAEVFFNTTGCLRNLSSTKQSNRQSMRKCRGLVDSLVSYVKDCVDAGNPDDKSVENCVCTLHNLTFQLEAEAPALFSRITALAKTVNRRDSQGDAGPIGCFSPQTKPSEPEQRFDFPVVEDPQPNGAGWLIHSKTLQDYLSLLGTSQQEETQEACCGALQNLTAQEGLVSGVMSQTIVQKLNGLQVITPLLNSSKVNMQRNTVALVGNLIKNPNLRKTLAHKTLPGLLGILSAGTKEGNESDDTLSMACLTSNCLLMNEPEMGKHLLNNDLINSLNNLSKNTHFPKSSKAAALLLHNLWSEKDLQSYLKKVFVRNGVIKVGLDSVLRKCQVNVNETL